MTADPSDSLTLPGAQLTVKSEEAFPVNARDWLRIRRCVEAIKDPTTWISSLGWLLIGVSTSTGLTLIPWQGSRSALTTPAERESWAWVSPFLAAVMILTLLAAVLCFAIQKTVKNHPQVFKQQILDDMDGIHVVEN